MIISSVATNPVAGTRNCVSHTAKAPDLFTPSLGGAEEVAGNTLITFMGRRVPTTQKPFTEEQREFILQNIKPGDIILETNTAYPGWQRMEFWTLRSHYTHAAIYEGEGQFLEATPPSVQRTDLREYLEGPIKVAIIRPPYKSEADVKAALDHCRGEVGKKYDAKFDATTSEEIYCAELVRDALLAMPNPITVEHRDFMGKKAVSPDAFLGIEGSERIYDDNSNYWKNKIHHWPVAAGTLGIATAGGYLGGVPGFAAGLVGGYMLSLCVGNWLQTGHFNMAGDGKK